jgi:hypothetical protein
MERTPSQVSEERIELRHWKVRKLTSIHSILRQSILYISSYCRSIGSYSLPQNVGSRICFSITIEPCNAPLGTLYDLRWKLSHPRL